MREDIIAEIKFLTSVLRNYEVALNTGNKADSIYIHALKQASQLRYEISLLQKKVA